MANLIAISILLLWSDGDSCVNSNRVKLALLSKGPRSPQLTSDDLCYSDSCLIYKKNDQPRAYSYIFFGYARRP